MFGISYGELFLLVGATAALVGPKDLPVIARTAGRLAGRAIGYVQLARGQFDNIMQQSQARQVQKDLQDAMQQLEAIRYEIRSVSLMNPGPMTRKFMDGPQEPSPNNNGSSEKVQQEQKPTNTVAKEDSPKSSGSTRIHSQATAYARLAESQAMKASGDEEYMNSEAGLFTVLPVSAESTGMLPKRKENAQGSDILLEAVVEAEVANNAKDFFSQPQNQIQ